ncbi:MAG: GMC family oxidoreductase, partial [Actinomycetota bacterium]|nr:GMC family oxidoreductase [Actinomycetota bacterium]
MSSPDPARPSTTGTEHVDTVVVGSGFGGAVSAFRLAEAGRSVVVLERGRAYPPGSFPRSPHEMGQAFWAPGEHLHGLFDVWSFDGFESVVSSGLGGGSLIYANVLLRKDEQWFVHEDPLPGGGYEAWPVTRAELDPHYDAVEAMLRPSPYPLDTEPYAATPKAHALQQAAERLGLDWQLPPLGVAFAPRPGADPAVGAPLDEAPYGNVHGLPRRTCLLDAECDVGCNAGAKQSLDHTYLSAAAHHGADLRTLCDVRSVRPGERGGYVVDYLRHRPGHAPGHGRITADRVVLAAGTYGTTHLLLSNRASLPGLGDALGTRFCGNGDLLAFLMPGERRRVLDPSRGPVITGTIRVPDAHDSADGTPGGRGFYLQDGGYPAFVDWMVDAARPTRGLGTMGFLVEWVRRRLSPSEDPRMSDEVARLIADGSLSAGSLPLLGMGRDVPDGVMSLDDDGYLAIDWTTDTSQAYFDRVTATIERISDALGTAMRQNPLTFLRRVVTVHPLGGAPMGHDPATGVCDDRGQVFGHPGLYVADGAAMPGPIGPNPSLTIAAHADRMATGILEGRPVRSAPARRRATAPTGLSFTEEMRGHLALGETEPEDGASGGHEVTVHLTITVRDVEAFVDEPAHVASVTGWVESTAVGGRCAIDEGLFNLFVPGPRERSRRMVYRLRFTGGDGVPRTLVGRKEVHDDAGADLWRDTTTLFARLLDGHAGGPPHADDEPDGATVAGAGVLRIGEIDLVRQLATFRTTGPDGAAALYRFGRFFLGELW